MIHNASEKGVGLIELILAIAIISGSFFAIAQVSIAAIKASRDRTDKAAALALAQEGIEAVRNIRDGSWMNNITTLTFGSTYYLTTSGGAWVLTGTNPGLIANKFTRTIVIDNVSRDINDVIVASGGTDDTGTKKVTATTSWGVPIKNIQLITYITDVLRN